MTSSLMQKDVIVRLVISFLHVYNKQNKREPFQPEAMKKNWEKIS